MESRKNWGGRDKAPYGAECRNPYGDNYRDPSEAYGSAPSGANRISPSGAPYEAEGSDWLGCSLVVDLGPVLTIFIIPAQNVLFLNPLTTCGLLFLKLLSGNPLLGKDRVGVLV